MKCFYHNDLDGRCAGSIVYGYEKNNENGFIYGKEDFFEVDYMMDLTPYLEKIEYGERVYFVDYSFTRKTKWVLDTLIQKKCDIIWCDHHKSSLELIDEFPELKYINGNRSDAYSGAFLTYEWLYLRDKYFIDEDDFLLYMPLHIRFVDDYDCWKFKFKENTTYFKLGMESMNHDALDTVWEDMSFNLLSDIINKGKGIKTYIDKDYDQYLNQYGYESIVNGHKALIVNRKTNSWIFGDKIKEYPIVCVWAFNGNKFSYTIYSEDKTVDCSEIAGKFGGGGHAGAAGFSSDELLFKKIN